MVTIFNVLSSGGSADGGDIFVSICAECRYGGSTVVSDLVRWNQPSGITVVSSSHVFEKLRTWYCWYNGLHGQEAVLFLKKEEYICFLLNLVF